MEKNYINSPSSQAHINVRITLGLVSVIQSETDHYSGCKRRIGHLIKALKNSQSTIKCLHDLPASSTVTQKGTFCFCGQKRSCEFFCPDQDYFMFGKAMTSFREYGCVHLRCFRHGRTAKIRMVKDTNNQNYSRSFFVCSERDDPCAFW